MMNSFNVIDCVVLYEKKKPENYRDFILMFIFTLLLYFYEKERREKFIIKFMWLWFL